MLWRVVVVRCAFFSRGGGGGVVDGGDLSLVGGGAEGYDELWLMVSPREEIERGYVGVVGKDMMKWPR